MSNPPLTPTELDRFLDKQEVICESGQVCPSYLTKLVVIDNERIKFCTGFLVEPDVVATSSSCLSNLLRLNGQDCSRNVFFFFGKTFNRPASRGFCSKVLQVSQNDMSKEPILWRDDVSFLSLSEPIHFRRSLEIVRDGLKNLKTYTMWGIEAVDDYAGMIRRNDCEAVHNTYVNPLTTKETSPVMTIAGCVYKNGFTGAPLVDSNGELRATVSQPMDQKLRDYIQGTGWLGQTPLKEILHATNFSCAPTIFDSHTADDEECTKDLNYTVVDQIRNRMLSPDVLYEDYRKNVETSLSTVSEYFRFAVTISGSGESQKLDVVPKCFKKISNWLSKLSGYKNFYYAYYGIPQRTYKRAMDGYGRLTGIETPSVEKKFGFEISLKSIRATGKSTVFMFEDGANLPSRPFQLAECAPTAEDPASFFLPSL